MNNKDELYHYGVKGMKWKGHVYATRDELKTAKQKYKVEKKEFKKDRKEFTKAYKSGKKYIDVKTGATFTQAGLKIKDLADRKGKAYANKVAYSALNKIKNTRVAAASSLGVAAIGAYAIGNILARIS